ncbi:enoyl-CoA hydratase/isomerase family protein [Candidatus Aminicenantes bacterium AC-335-A11]|jgi:methylglutaconyl-CoA hydratase|nr:enoyl-CoA hydratase/isomerase family protein [SCandidatus Aminicenantes bacterium Aminicenantia_JdfR_composite]MCP2596871.1 enoyl-CoA hydratase/isomerase family protein [Candidatus Aminicenantes bacterium AC-335-G13]MCP2598490.1 enoyl-CoA hydratase/isomerase family protein [Candidatus Aminicenantes bacterium AC-335-L06]MCP2606214.1 enoyl-CoA hydratase/isomerase family protein [Candidatus Aminicenantes bacterium AC-708-I09]MCP2618645.1 enoyl-CoA hydratase/isomerase family protein [Candidatus 
MKYETIIFEEKNQVAKISLNRPEVHNAFNKIMVEELSFAFNEIAKNSKIRVVILTGEGKSFCAGADLNWMREIVNYSYDENLEEAMQIAELLYLIYSLPKPTIARVNGTTIGGGTGLMCACDIIIASEKAKFGLSEVKLGLVPAVISPYVIKRIGEASARRYFLTGERLTAEEALKIGLVNTVVSDEKLDSEVERITNFLLTSGPNAIANCKELLIKIPGMNLEEAKAYTAKMIADLRISEEGQEGMSAFLEKRKPKWVKT